MSINFSAVVRCFIDYLTTEDDETRVEHTSEILTSTLDLSNFRALRSICPPHESELNQRCEEPGTETLTCEETIRWLEDSPAGLHICAAVQYLRYLKANFGDREGASTCYRIEVEVSWA